MVCAICVLTCRAALFCARTHVVREVSCSWFRTYAGITTSTVDTQYPHPEALLDEPDYLRHRILGRDRNLHVDVVRHQVPFFHPALFLLGQVTQDFTAGVQHASYVLESLISIGRNQFLSKISKCASARKNELTGRSRSVCRRSLVPSK